jgi:phage terminase large subunit-like protein
VRLVSHVTFQPSPDQPLQFEQTVEQTLLNWKRQFDVREVRFDPWQLVSVAQRLSRARLPMVEFTQTVGNLTEASSNLFDLIRARNLIVYPDAAMRRAVSQASAFESSRGWRIVKERASYEIDVVVALAQAALGAVKQAGRTLRVI